MTQHTQTEDQTAAAAPNTQLNSTQTDLNRRTAVKLVGGAVLLTGCAPMMQPMMNTAAPAAAPATPAPAAAVTPAAAPAAAPAATSTLGAFPAVGSTQLVQVGGKGVLLARIPAAQAGAASSGDVHLLALSDRCTHNGCGVQAAGTGAATAFNCPCHGSVFTLTGDVVKGPAVRPLDRVAVRIDGQNVFVG
ncbi:ubiquinol-cytochrome c reductase iron-sulfur subunit [Deinococcus sp. QL22]|uniref:QcrA and Rieske domain-containing protein n=1 Tax=Deinococcus sp. QL22 TaxID=2939437 RepID=UPI0020172A69|nr:ubiquinol-cytochrome c reductase iron-sulfur subunit [Deinococcus sp. QL22]UQN07020.1 ubiquinol-cytochrome c reductase iron-sulfur subunit [Deinococcus sp. QL22]